MRGFHGQDFFLHSGYPALVELEGVFYATVEHAFSAYRVDDIVARAEIRNAQSYQRAAILGRRFQARDPRDCEDAWRALTRQKFTIYEALGSRLVGTGRTTLVHEDPHDLYYGTWGGVGENRAGLYLMQLRSELRKLLVG